MHSFHFLLHATPPQSSYTDNILTGRKHHIYFTSGTGGWNRPAGPGAADGAPGVGR